MWNFDTKAKIIVGTVKLREGSLTALLTERCCCCGARVDKIFTGLATNQTAVFQATIYSYNLKGRSERVTLPKMTLDAEECCHAAVSHHYLVEFPNFDIYTTMDNICQNWWTLNKTICVVLVNINFYGSRLHCHYLSWYLLWIYEHHFNLSLGKYELL